MRTINDFTKQPPEELDMELAFEGGSVRFNPVEECSIPSDENELEEHHEAITAKIASVNAMLEKFRYNRDICYLRLKEARADAWTYYKFEHSVGGKAPSNDAAENLVKTDAKVNGIEKEYYEYCSQVRRLEDIVEDMRAARVTMRAALENRVT